MAETTSIAWTDATFNPWIGCTRVGPGCDHCYAEALMSQRWQRVQWGTGQPRQRTSAANWTLPVRWNREHPAFYRTHARRRRVFCASLADVFDNEVPGAWRSDLWDLILQTPHLHWLLLTKRIGNARTMLPSTPPMQNVWLGATIVNQQEANRDIPTLLDTPAAIRWLSIEPMLGPVDLDRGGWSFLSPLHPPPGNRIGWRRGIDWVIVGGESGRHARSLRPEWVRLLRDQCAGAGVPFFFKQWGGLTAQTGGCLLDGSEVKEWPRPAAHEQARP